MKNIYMSIGAEGSMGAENHSHITWTDELIVIGPRAFQQMKEFFKNVKFKAGDLICSNNKSSEDCGRFVYVVDFNHEKYFCVDDNGSTYEIPFNEAEKPY